eukprot:3498272-Pleurochrysis_carterae.AAC.2
MAGKSGDQDRNGGWEKAKRTEGGGAGRRRRGNVCEREEASYGARGGGEKTKARANEKWRARAREEAT